MAGKWLSKIVCGMIGIEHAGTRYGREGTWCALRSLQVEDAPKGKLRGDRYHCGAVLAEAPKKSSQSGTSSSFELSVSLLYGRVQIVLGCLLLLCTLTLLVAPQHAHRYAQLALGLLSMSHAWHSRSITYRSDTLQAFTQS